MPTADGQAPFILLEALLAEGRDISVGVISPGEHDPWGVPLIRSGDLKSDRINPNPAFRISRKVHERDRRTELRGGELLMSLVGEVGRCAVVPPNMSGWNVARAVAVLRLRNPDDASYVRLVLTSPSARHLIDAWSNSTLQKTINLSEVKRLPIPWPSRRQRMGIVQVFEALDAKIENNHAISVTLDRMARAIYEDWFVDFGPTRARARRRPSYLAPQTWALFPDRLDEMGKPAGWPTVALEAVAVELRRGITPVYIEQGGVRVLNQRCVRNGRVVFGPARRHDPAARTVMGRELQFGDILVNSTGVGTLGRVGQIWEIDEPIIADGHVTVVRADPARIDPYYLGANLTAREKELEALGEGSTGQIELSRKKIAALPLLLPPPEIQLGFAGLTKPLVDLITAKRQENFTLRAIREHLLPKLISGAIRLRDVHKAIEEAA